MNVERNIATNSEIVEITLLVVCLMLLLVFVASFFQHMITGDATILPFIDFICGNDAVGQLNVTSNS